MTTAAPALLPAPRSADGLLRRAWAFSPLLTLAGLASLALIPLFILAALRGQSIVAPDGLTLAVAALGAGALTAAIVVILRREDVKRDA